MEDDPVLVKFEWREVDPLRKQPSCTVHISPRNSGTVIDSEKSSINANTKLTMSFPLNIKSLLQSFIV